MNKNSTIQISHGESNTYKITIDNRFSISIPKNPSDNILSIEQEPTTVQPDSKPVQESIQETNPMPAMRGPKQVQESVPQKYGVFMQPDVNNKFEGNGELVLEDYYLDEAICAGKAVKARRRSVPTVISTTGVDVDTFKEPEDPELIETERIAIMLHEWLCAELYNWEEEKADEDDMIDGEKFREQIAKFKSRYIMYTDLRRVQVSANV